MYRQPIRSRTSIRTPGLTRQFPSCPLKTSSKDIRTARSAGKRIFPVMKLHRSLRTLSQERTLIPLFKKRFIGLALPFFSWGLFVFPIVISGNSNFKELLSEWGRNLMFPEYGYWFLIVLFCMHVYYVVACLLSN